ncbi:hypothetical protein [Butyricicoccus pullicaecorum]|uniref:Uncharacterized protein n=1 Tax=Butyricicoccus pullicaecorum 1.2 TaxID=1203606 RepID=R8W0S2_9FIRM|nr:hypothetical protein [Butyricicoccus pullicaecorum]EOQ38299.1 hypothetical protein HMPREF1526_01329 [Butyricicoccus pullicaecorum 1.2]SKA54326.1 hypothetical protein SAMN02745978_00524 [Butyricicoccus pullicaecorum DSM 23266]
MIEWVSMMSTCFLYVSLLLGSFIIAIALIAIALIVLRKLVNELSAHVRLGRMFREYLANRTKYLYWNSLQSENRDE